MDLARQSLAITLIFSLLWAVLWLLKRRGVIRIRGHRSGRDLIESRGKLALTAQHSIHLVQLGHRNLVVAVHPGGMTLLCDAPRSLGGEGAGGPTP